MQQTALVLTDGTIFYGKPFGAPSLTLEELTLEQLTAGSPDMTRRLRDVGEVLFNTAMSGYGEVLTDPSYTGQIVVMTYPHAGNYGIDVGWSESGPEDTTRPRPVKPAALVVRSLYTGPVPPGRITLTDYLAENGIPGVTDIDTRALTLNLRDEGIRNGLLCRPADGRKLSPAEVDQALALLAAFPAMEGRALIDTVGVTTPVQIARGAGPHLVLYDCGAKANITRELQALDCSLTLVPSTATAPEIRAVGADAVLLSNGPGDPAVLQHQVEQTRALLGELPLLGICLGHQIIAEAVGARTFKMKFGHHGINHPVREEISGSRVFVTSQNHGFAVDEQSLPSATRVWFRNANDRTVEGLWDDNRRIRTTQFHPESAPGPTDSRWIFKAFLEVL